jgi:maltose alpha-D-glucosyltransferase / alpha-amylase
LQPELLERLRGITNLRGAGMRMRVHGDYHLGQVLHTGKDFLIIDFEGEPARSINSRRLKRTALTDIAGMLRSFDYAAQAALLVQIEQGAVSPERLRWVAPWARFWSYWAGVVFLKSYYAGARRGNFLPKTAADLRVLLKAHLLSKALYELRYELNNRPAWLPIPLEGILELMQTNQLAPAPAEAKSAGLVAV